jgi:hypothetical protein
MQRSDLRCFGSYGNTAATFANMPLRTTTPMGLASAAAMIMTLAANAYSKAVTPRRSGVSLKP